MVTAKERASKQALRSGMLETLPLKEEVKFRTEHGSYKITDASNPQSTGLDVDIVSLSNNERVNYEVREGVLISAIGNTDWYFPGLTERFIQSAITQRNGSRDLIPEEWVYDHKKRKVLNNAGRRILALLTSEMSKQVSL